MAEKEKRFKLTRREFLKAISTLGFSNFLIKVGLIPPRYESESLISPEPEKLQKTILTIDIFSDSSLLSDIFQLQFNPMEELRNMGVSNASSLADLKEAVPKNQEQQIALFLKAAELRYKDHGETVQKIQQEVSQLIWGNQKDKSNKPDNSGQINLWEAASITEICKSGSEQNPTLKMNISYKKVARLIRTSNSKLVNISAVIGDLSMIYELYERVKKHNISPSDIPQKTSSITIRSINPETGDEKVTHSGVKYIDPKTGEEIPAIDARPLLSAAATTVSKLRSEKERFFSFPDAYVENPTDNLIEMVKLAHEFPDRIFVAAAGNPSIGGIPDLREIRSLLEKKELWPTNLILVGVMGDTSQGKTPFSLGADFYIDIDTIKRIDSNLKAASSWATPIVSAMIQALIQKDFTVQEIKDFLNKHSDILLPETEGYHVLQFNTFINSDLFPLKISS